MNHFRVVHFSTLLQIHIKVSFKFKEEFHINGFHPNTLQITDIVVQSL